MSGAVALQSPIPTIYDWRATDLQLGTPVTPCIEMNDPLPIYGYLIFITSKDPTAYKSDYPWEFLPVSD